MRAIAALLSYYRQPDRAPDLEASVAEQWGEDVEDYPLWAVQEACRIWRREPGNRRGPHPGEFRAICEALVGKARQQRDRLRRCLEMPPLLSAPIPLTAEERTALEERRKSERMAELARFEEIKATLLAEGKWPGRIAGPAPACDTAPVSDTKSIHCPSVLMPAEHRTSGFDGNPFPPETSNAARAESVGVPASPEQPASIGSSGAVDESRTSDRTPEVTICRDAGIAGPPDQACLTHRDRRCKPPLCRRRSLHSTESRGKKSFMRRHPESVEACRMRGDLHSLFSVHLVRDSKIDIDLVRKDLANRRFPAVSGSIRHPASRSMGKERAVSGPATLPPLKRPELRFSQASAPSRPAVSWPRPELPICVQGCSTSSNLGWRWSQSRHHRNAKVPPSKSLAGACFLQVIAECQPLPGCLPIVRTSVGRLGKGRTSVAGFRPQSMFSNADLRTGGGLTIRRSRFPGIAGIFRQDKGEAALPQSPARNGIPVVRQRVRLFPCRDAEYPGTALARDVIGKTSRRYHHQGQEPEQVNRRLERQNCARVQVSSRDQGRLQHAADGRPDVISRECSCCALMMPRYRFGKISVLKIA